MWCDDSGGDDSGCGDSGGDDSGCGMMTVGVMIVGVV